MSIQLKPASKSIVLDGSLNAPLYVQLRDALGAIIERDFTEGDLFFSDLELVQQLGISRFTVRQAVDELVRAGYLARRRGQGTFVRSLAVKAQTLGHVGAFIGSYESEYATAILDMLSRECSRRGLLLHVYYTDDGGSMSDAYTRVVRNPDEEGLLFLACGFELYSLFAERGYRTVALEAGLLEYPGPSVETDSAAAMQIGMQHLIDLGHRDITLLVTEKSTSLSVREKIDTFEQIAEESAIRANIFDCEVPETGGPRDAAYRVMCQIWDEGHRPTAVFTVSDFGAFGVLKWCADNGVKVPGDISVLGFEGIRSGDLVTPALTSVAHPIKRLAETLVESLVTNSRKQVRLCPSLIRRQSTGPVSV